MTYTVTQQPTEANGWTAIVTATITGSGYQWGTLPTGWEETSSTVATYTEVIEPNLCEEAVPVPPAIEGNVCTGGVFTPPTVVPGTTTGMTYEVTQQPTAGNNWTYIVFATVENGYEWGNLSGTGWVELTAAKAFFIGTVAPNLCRETVPVAPSVTDGVCTGGEWTAPTVDPVTTTGINYVVTQLPNAGNGWTYIVTATVQNGYAWGDLTGTGWVEVSSATATYTGTVDRISASRPFRPLRKRPMVSAKAANGPRRRSRRSAALVTPQW
ncbi:MAG: hypothetical protein R2848_02505 [Thermomicrobiales bacterium]